ncbi:TPA: aminotransferase, partial [Mannheimia haemolytica]|nr:aminotransferase [Mannheimia haemolytica]
LLVQGSGFNWKKPDHFRVVTLPYAHQIEEAIGRLANFLKTYRQD